MTSPRPPIPGLRGERLRSPSSAQSFLGARPVTATSCIDVVSTATGSGSLQMLHVMPSTSHQSPVHLTNPAPVDQRDTQTTTTSLENSFTDMDFDLYTDSFLQGYDLYSCPSLPNMCGPPNVLMTEPVAAGHQPWWSHSGDDQTSSSTVLGMICRDRTLEASAEGQAPMISTTSNPVQTLHVKPGYGDGGEVDPKIDRAWAARSKKFRRLMPDLWTDVLHYEQENVFCKLDPSNSTSETPRRGGNRWGFDESCRIRVMEALEHEEISLIMSPTLPPQGLTRESVPGLNRASERQMGGLISPQAGLFDISLDLYAFQFQPILPLMHIPTFSAKNTPTTLLLAMVSLGFSILGTTGASRFLSAAFPVSLPPLVFSLTAF